jgi:SP family sugar:H+ symporter-like MFS transporter
MAISLTSTRYVTLVAAGAAVGGLLFGFDTSTMNSAISGIRSTLGIRSSTIGLVVAIVLIGCAFGAWFAGPVAARLGRTRVMLFTGVLITAGSLAVALTSAVMLLSLFRFIVGLGIGAASAVVPAYIVEIAPTSIRGRLGTFWQFAIVIGQFLGLLMGNVLTRLAGTEANPMPWGGAAWRWMFVAVAILAAVYIAITRMLPQSPYDLIGQGEMDQAWALLARISDEPVDEQAMAIQRTLEGKHRASTLEDLRGPRFGLQPIVWTGILLAAFQQLVGINVVKTYSNSLWQAVGFSTRASFTISMITVLVSIAATGVAIAVMDKVGRRTLLLSGAATMVVALGTLAVCFSTTAGNGAAVSLGRGASSVALVAINVFAVAFGMTWGPVMWLMLGELFDSELRTIAVAVCTAVNWMTNWAVTRTFPLLAVAGLGLAYGLYTVFAVLAFVFVLKALPETRGRPLS